MSKRKQVFSLLINQPWAMRRDVLESGLKMMQGGIKDFQAAASDKYTAGNNDFQFSGTVAEIPIVGPITRYANCLSDMNGYSTVEDLMAAVDLAAESPNIRGVLLNINSPGGTVDGVSELADKIFSLRSKKPVVAYVGGDAASAAYWLGSSASKMIVNNTGMVGSIGVYSAYEDSRKADELAGISEYIIVSSQSPKKVPDPATDEGRGQIQSHVDALADIFVNTVARNRGTTAENVLENFGQGDVFLGAEGVARGMADKVGVYEDAIAELEKMMNPKSLYTGGRNAMTLEELKSQFPEHVKVLMDDGAKAESARIQSIEELAGAENSEVIKAVKFDGKTTAEQAAVLILKAEKAKKAELLEKMKGDAEQIPPVGGEQVEGNEKKGAVDLLLKAAEKRGRLK